MFGYSEQLIPKVALCGLFLYTPPQNQSRAYLYAQAVRGTLLTKFLPKQGVSMKHMNKTPEFWEQIFSYLSQYKDQGVFAGLAGLVAILRGMYNGGGWKKTLLDGVLCAFMGWFAKDLLAFMGMNQDLAYITSVMIGYWGVEKVSGMIKGKAGVNNG